ncbi:hypothetical protein [Vibrio genomosp. F10]|uniref:hypothetical protein n=1 Tax=Vibrio genomosp. F10 TaxID=723171 RepID=UPI0002F882E3|nr:hypothetical protein [Vibrio genomosp. F10]OEF01128.1 hypothetical protein A1QK_01765 [Vibrio genomosp. F10 str. 9ZD137]
MAPTTLLLPDFISPKRADYLFIESNYGNKFHDSIESRSQRLLKIIHRSLHNGRTVLIPAFSVGCTQELLFNIESLLHKEQISDRIPIILDSTQATKITKTIVNHR